MRIMKNKHLWIVSILVICSILPGAARITVAQSPIPPGCTVDVYPPTGAQYLICMPTEVTWNGDLVVFAHGYVAPGNPVQIPQDQLVLDDGTPLPTIITGMGFAFATTSYRANGLVVKDGVVDLVDLVGIFSAGVAPPNHVYLAGASEGGLITALATEQQPEIFDGGLATCGPVGDFQRQINYWGDVRVLFDYFYPRVLPAFTPDRVPVIPQDVIDNWYWCGDPDRNPYYECAADPDDAYELQVREALLANPRRTEEWVRVAGIPVDPEDPEATLDTLVQLLWYNVFATNDAVEALGGRPYDNTTRWYWGSRNDRRLNRRVARFSADPVAIAEIEAHYQTTGDLSTPIVMMHTVGDAIVPYWHEPLYRWKVIMNGDQALHTNIPIFRYGHCNFTTDEVLLAFGWLVYQVSDTPLWMTEDVPVPTQLMER